MNTRIRGWARPSAFALAGVVVAVAATACWGFHPVSAGGGSTATRAAVRGIDGQLYFVRGTDPGTPVFSGGYASGFGSIIGTPAVVSVPLSSAQPLGPGTAYFIATGADHNLWVKSENYLIGWQRLTPSTPLYCSSSPAAASVSAHAAGAVLLVVACRGSDGSLWETQGTVVSDPAILPSLSGWTSLGGSMLDGPAVAAVPPYTTPQDELTFFVNGSDGHVWTRTLANATWSQQPWSCLGQPAAAAESGNTVTAFACQGHDHAVWAATNVGSGWGALFSLGGSIIGGPGIALDADTWTVVAEGADRALWQDTSPILFSTSTTWTGWSSAGGRLTGGASAAALLPQIWNP